MLKKILTLFMVLIFVLAPFSSTYGLTNEIMDMPKGNHWSYDALDNAINNGLINGYADKINPTGNLSRAQLATILSRAFGAIDMADISKYTDVSENSWYYTDMSKAVNMKIINGTATNKLLPLAEATREETFCVIARALKLDSENTDVINKFKDKKDIAPWALASISALVENSYVNGSNDMLNPKGKITREEFAQLMDNIIKSYITGKGTYSETYSGNLMINSPDVVLKDAKVSGDLILGDGVGNGDITIDNTVIDGRLVIRGGGENTINLKNNSNVGSITISKTGSGAIRIKTEEGCKVDVVYIDDGKDDVIVEGVYNQVVVSSPIPVALRNAVITVVSTTVEGSTVSVEGNSDIKTVEIAKDAENTSVTVAEGATVQKLNSNADDVVVKGEGKVVEATVLGSNTMVNTKDTKLTIKTEESKPDQGQSSKSSRNTSSNNNSSEPISDNTCADVKSSSEFLAAIKNNSVSSVKIAESFMLEESSEDNAGYVTDKEILIPAEVTLTILNTTLHVYGELTNNGKIVLGEIPQEYNYSAYGTIQIWPQAKLVNNGTIEGLNGWIQRMDDLKPSNGEITVIPSTIEGTKSSFIENLIYDIAIVHDIIGLKKAATDADTAETIEYEKIDIMEYGEEGKCDIQLEENLTIDADMYIEWGNGIEVSEGATLTFDGADHYISNNADMWVYGTLNLGNGYRLENQAKIQIGGISGVDENNADFTNNGTIDNRSYIEVSQNGHLKNFGLIYNENAIKVDGGSFDGTGYVFVNLDSQILGTVPNVFFKVYDYQELEGALGSLNNTDVVIAGYIELENDIIIDKNVSIGYKHEAGELKTNGHKITINSGGVLTIYEGGLVVNSQSAIGGEIVNNGEINVPEGGNLTIEEGGTLETSNDIEFFGSLDLYDWSEDSIITGSGKIYQYNDRACFTESVFNMLYQYEEDYGSSTITITPSAIGAKLNSTTSAIKNAAEGSVGDWFIDKEGNNGNYRRHYAYAAMIENNISINSIDDLNRTDHDPYDKLTYGYAEMIFTDLAEKLGVSGVDGVSSFLNDICSNGIEGSNNINSYGDSCEFVQLFIGFESVLIM